MNMQQTITINLSHSEFTDLINEAVGIAIDKKLKPPEKDELFTEQQAEEYCKCSAVFLWKKRKEGKINAVNAGRKILYPKSSLDCFLQLKTKKG
jgi:hypothetical protein